jgi:hypothetical protein
VVNHYSREFGGWRHSGAHCVRYRIGPHRPRLTVGLEAGLAPTRVNLRRNVGYKRDEVKRIAHALNTARKSCSVADVLRSIQEAAVHRTYE